jgi:hypothetical protein
LAKIDAFIVCGCFSAIQEEVEAFCPEGRVRFDVDKLRV